MKVKELIQILSGHDREAEVYIEGGEHVLTIKHVQSTYMPDKSTEIVLKYGIRVRHA